MCGHFGLNRGMDELLPPQEDSTSRRSARRSACRGWPISTLISCRRGCCARSGVTSTRRAADRGQLADPLQVERRGAGGAPAGHGGADVQRAGLRAPAGDGGRPERVDAGVREGHAGVPAVGDVLPGAGGGGLRGPGAGRGRAHLQDPPPGRRLPARRSAARAGMGPAGRGRSAGGRARWARTGRHRPHRPGAVRLAAGAASRPDRHRRAHGRARLRRRSCGWPPTTSGWRWIPR